MCSDSRRLSPIQSTLPDATQFGRRADGVRRCELAIMVLTLQSGVKLIKVLTHKFHQQLTKLQLLTYVITDQ